MKGLTVRNRSAAFSAVRSWWRHRGFHNFTGHMISMGDGHVGGEEIRGQENATVTEEGCTESPIVSAAVYTRRKK